MIDIFKQYQSSLAIFFANEGIITDITSQNPLLPLEETVIKLNIFIEIAYICNSVLIVKCDIENTSDKLLQIGFEIFPIKKFLPQTTPQLQNLILKGYHWLNWDKQSRFCGQCGGSLESKIETPEKQCNVCNKIFFPRFSPAVMVLIQKNDQILLARSKHFTPGVYSVIAGFVELGETAEMAAHREVKEEVGLTIGDLSYFASQTWPFPDSFMMGFKATYVSGDIQIDKTEIEDAKWFSLYALPALPHSASISRKLIDSVIPKHN